MKRVEPMDHVESTEAHAETPHLYGDRVHLLGDPWIHQLLARIGSPDVKPPVLLDLVRSYYRTLLSRVAAREFPDVARSVDTRMKANTPAGTWHGITVDPDLDVVVANVLRGGNHASLACFEELCAVLGPDRVRLDYLYLARRIDSQSRVEGVDSAGSKIGGSVDGAILLIPDPMGATGSTVLHTIGAYAERDCGTPRAILAMHLIVTPEYLRQVLAADANVRIYAGRVDRGTSTPEVQATVPGTHPALERGLDAHDYIVPGAGGIGEVLNNSFV